MTGFKVKDIEGNEIELVPGSVITVEVERKGNSFEYCCVARSADIYGNKAILTRGGSPYAVMNYADKVRGEMEDFFDIPLPFTSFADCLV